MSDKKNIKKMDEKSLFCIALHVSNLMEDKKENKVGNITTACKFCTKYGVECAKLASEGRSYFHETLKRFSQLTGVYFSPIIDFREMVTKGRYTFFK